ncbi:trypco2 family protein [Pannonibacter phragmitetus]|uniref:trypco2 family protein n=1 Tax=Pannonibacter phragmitetus TaxID=121719 RepID=UPI003D2F4FAA
MELKHFIAETLSQIIEGIKLAQEKPDGENVNALMKDAQFGGHLINVGQYGIATRVDFDVSVTTETEGGAGAKVKVFGIGVEGGGKHTAGSANKISFSVPIRLPEGDKDRMQKVDEKRKFPTFLWAPPQPIFFNLTQLKNHHKTTNVEMKLINNAQLTE